MPCKLDDWAHSAQQRGLLAREAFRKSEDTAAHCGVSLAYLEQLACSLRDGWTEAGAQADCSTAGVMQRLLMPVCARMAGKTRWASHVSAVCMGLCRVGAGSKQCAVQSGQPGLWSLQQRTSLAVDVTASVRHLNTSTSTTMRSSRSDTLACTRLLPFLMGHAGSGTSSPLSTQVFLSGTSFTPGPPAFPRQWLP